MSSMIQGRYGNSKTCSPESVPKAVAQVAVPVVATMKANATELIESFGKDGKKAFNMFTDGASETDGGSETRKSSRESGCAMSTTTECTAEWTPKELQSCMLEIRLSPLYPKLLHSYLKLAKAEGDVDRHALLAREAFKLGYMQGVAERAAGRTHNDPEVESFLAKYCATLDAFTKDLVQLQQEVERFASKYEARLKDMSHHCRHLAFVCNNPAEAGHYVDTVASFVRPEGLDVASPESHDKMETVSENDFEFFSSNCTTEYGSTPEASHVNNSSMLSSSSKYAVDEDDVGSKEMVMQEVVKADHKDVMMSEAVVKVEVQVLSSNGPRFSNESHPIPCETPSQESPGVPFHLEHHLKRK